MYLFSMRYNVMEGQAVHVGFLAADATNNGAPRVRLHYDLRCERARPG